MLGAVATKQGILLVVSSPDHAPLATRGNGLATIEAFLVEGAVHYQDFGNDQSDCQFHMMVM